MRTVILILSNILLITAIVMVIKHNGKRFIGLKLNKKWVTAIVLCELVIAVLCYVGYTNSIDESIANDMLWNSLIANYRGVLPTVAITKIIDFRIPSSGIVQLLLIFLGALLFDYVVLKIVTLLKGKSQVQTV